MHLALRKVAMTTNTLLPIPTYLAFLVVDGVWGWRELGIALVGMFGLISPAIAVFMQWWHRGSHRPVNAVLQVLAVGGTPAPGELELGRRALFRAPWNGAASVTVTWGLVIPTVLWVWVRAWSPHAGPWGEVALGGLVVGPIMGIVALFAQELVLRPYVAALFDEGGVAAYVDGPSVTLRTRVLASLVVLGGGSVLLLAGLTLRLVLRTPERYILVLRLLALDGYWLAIVLLLTAVFAASVRDGVGLPLLRVRAALEQVEAGDLGVRLPVESNDPVGQVSDRFNRMVVGLRERERIRSAFGRYVSPELASRALTGALDLGGEVREVTVLFSDVRGFTALSEHLDPQTLVVVMNRYFAAMVACVQAEGGHVNKFIGDGLMALFGAPAPLLAAPEAAVRAALAMETALAGFNVEQRVLGLPEFAIGIGVATGPVVVGHVGAPDRLEYTAIGDVVNTASRIEGLTKELGALVLLDATTASRVAGAIATLERGRLPVKGKLEPVAVFSPVPAAAEAPRV